MSKSSYLLTEEGLKKVNAAFVKSCGKQFPSQWDMALCVGLDRGTIKKLMERTGGVNRGTLERLCDGLILELDSDLEENFHYKLQGQEISTSDPSRSQEGVAVQPSGEADDVEVYSHFYVERVPYEAQCYETILQPGALIRIKAPRQMGKTLLVERLLEKVALKGYRTANLSLKLADRTHFTDLDKFLRWFCTNVSRQLGLSSQLEKYWDEEGMGSKVSCTTYFEEYLLQKADIPLVLCLDDVDWVFPYPVIYEDFFALLRFWHEKAKSPRKLWTRLRLVVVHSTEAYIRLNINESPFNVGVLVELPEFNQQQVQDLVKQHGLEWNAASVEQLMKMVGGHPYLVQQVFFHLKICQEIALDELLKTAPTESGIYKNHLRSHLLDLQQHPELALALKQVVTSTGSVRLQPMPAYKLHSMGLVKLQGNEAQSRCNLYSKYFRDYLEDI